MDTKPLTKQDLIEVLQAMDLPSRTEVRSMVQEAADAILAGVDTMFENHEAKEEIRFQKIEHDIADLKMYTPSTTEFNELKRKVDKFLIA